MAGVNIIGVADCEDAATAKIACAAAKEGRIVYLAINADDVTGALNKWIKLAGDKETAIENLMGISNQRLLRKLCDMCKQGYEPNKEMLRKFNIPAEKAKAFYRPGTVATNKRGKEMICDNCQGTGFVDRTGVFEIILTDEALKKDLVKSESSSEISR